MAGIERSFQKNGKERPERNVLFKRTGAYPWIIDTLALHQTKLNYVNPKTCQNLQHYTMTDLDVLMVFKNKEIKKRKYRTRFKKFQK